MKLFLILFLLATSLAANVQAQVATGLPSPCLSDSAKQRAESREMLQQMRNMRPQANSQIDRRAQQQNQRAISDMQERANQMMAPYIARINSIRSQASGCASVACAESVYSQSSQLYADIMNRVLPEIQAMMASAQSEMAESQKVNLDKLRDIYQKNTGQPLPSSRGSVYFPPLCKTFKPGAIGERKNPFMSMSEWLSGSASLSPAERSKRNIAEWNEKNGSNLGEWVCVGQLAMGNVRCFQKQEDPQGYGRVCEKASGQILGCYDTTAAWTPVAFARNSSSSISWFDNPPPKMRVMTGGVVVEERETKAMEQEQKKIIDEFKIAPLLRDPESTSSKKKPLVEPPLPFEVLEDKIRSGKGLSQQDLMQMSESDWNRFYQVTDDIQKQSAKADWQRASEEALKDGGEYVGKKTDEAAGWVQTNKEHIDSTIDMLEVMALIGGPTEQVAVKGIEAVALTSKVASRLLLVRAQGGSTEKYAFELALIMGPEGLNKLTNKGVSQALADTGFSTTQAEEIARQASWIAKSIEKANEAKEKSAK